MIAAVMMMVVAEVEVGVGVSEGGDCVYTSWPVACMKCGDCNWLFVLQRSVAQ